MVTESNIESFGHGFLSNITHAFTEAGPALLRMLGVTAALSSILWLGRALVTTIFSPSITGLIPLALVIILTPLAILRGLMPLINLFLQKVILPEALREQQSLTIVNKHNAELDSGLRKLYAQRLQHTKDKINFINNAPNNIPEASPAGLIGAACALSAGCFLLPVVVNGVIATAITSVVGSGIGNFAYHTWCEHNKKSEDNLLTAAGVSGVKDLAKRPPAP